MRKIHSGQADQKFIDWSEAVAVASLFLSVITVQELEIGVKLVERKDMLQGRILREWLEQKVMVTFSGRILPVDIAIVRTSASLHIPDPQPFRDSLIEATAIEHGMTLVTRNIKDFRSSRVTLLNPWTGALER